jgi:hypothetical protein
MLSDLLLTLSPKDLLLPAGLDTALFEPADRIDSEKWLRCFLEHLAGRRTFESVTADALASARPEEAFRLAARAGAPLSASLTTRLDALWKQWGAEHETLVPEVRQLLEGVRGGSSSLGEMAGEFLVELAALSFPEARPLEPMDVEQALHARQQLFRLWSDASELQELARQEVEGQRARLYEAARRAFERVLSSLEGRPSAVDASEVAALRAMPDLILNGRVGLLEQLATTEAGAGDAALQAELSAFATTDRKPPLFRRLPVRVAPPASAAQLPLTGSLSATAEYVIREGQPAPRGLGSAEELRRLAGRAAAGRSDKETAALWLGLARATQDAMLRLGALAQGLLFEGKSYLALNQYRLATELLRDAFLCLYDSGTLQEDEALERAALALIASRAWPRYLASGRERDSGVQALDWVDRPREMFTWIRENGAADVIAALYVDFERLEIGDAFLDLVRPHFGQHRELLRACASSVLKPHRVVGDPEFVAVRVRALLATEEPPQALVTALEQIVQELAGFGKGRLSARSRELLLKQIDIIERELDRLPRSSFAPVDEIKEQLPPLLRNIVQGAEPQLAPRLSLQPLLKAFFPEERYDEVLVPVVVTNAENGAAAADLSLQLSIAEGGPEVFFEDGSVLERAVGALGPGESTLVGFPLNLSEDLATRRTECRFRAVLLAGRKAVLDETFSVAVRPGNARGSRPSPYTIGEVVTGEHFIGREREVAMVRDSLVGGSRDRTPIVVGIRRIGKTSLLKKVMEDPEVVRAYSPIYLSVEDRPDSDTTVAFLTYLCERIRDHLPQEHQQRVHFHRKELSAEPYLAFERFTQSLTALGMKKRILLVIDEFDRLLDLARATEERQRQEGRPLPPQESFQSQVFGALRKALLHCDALRMIFAGLPALLDSTRYQDRLFGLLLPVQVKHFSENDASKVVDASAEAFQTSRAAREEIFRATGLQPYLLQVVCHHLFARMVDSGRDQATPLDVADVIEVDIVTKESYFSDYLSMVGTHQTLLRAVALAQREPAKRGRRFVGVKEIARELERLGYEWSSEEVQKTLDELRKSERPLVKRSPNRTDQYQLVIGMLGDRLIRKGVS